MTIAIIDDYEVLKDGLFRRLKKILPEANIIFAKNVKSLFAQAHYHKFDLVHGWILPRVNYILYYLKTASLVRKKMNTLL